MQQSMSESDLKGTFDKPGERNIHEILNESSFKEKNNAEKDNTIYKSHPTSLSLSSIATSSLTLTPSTPSQNGDSCVKTPQSKIDTIKSWSISTYKCTKQLMYEKLGKTSRTVDAELETQIESLRETQRKYLQLLRLSRALTSHFYHVVQIQHGLGEAFSDLANKSSELQEEFLYNSETQRNLTKNGETLINALNFFISSVSTLCNKTIEDTLLTIRQYESARIEYDAYRTDFELLNQAPRTDNNAARLEETQLTFQQQKEHFEKLKSDVAVKIRFLDENRIKVMHKQLLLFHNAIAAYFSGNQKALEATIKQFNIKVKSPHSSFSSWLEQ